MKAVDTDIAMVDCIKKWLGREFSYRGVTISGGLVPIIKNVNNLLSEYLMKIIVTKRPFVLND